MNSAFGSGILRTRTLNRVQRSTTQSSVQNGVLNVERAILAFDIQNAVSNVERNHERKKKSVGRMGVQHVMSVDEPRCRFEALKQARVVARILCANRVERKDF